MAQRGRKPESALQVLPFVPGRGGRPPPPSELDAIEAQIWRAVVDALPAFWIDRRGELVLRRLCAQGAILERREARLRALRAQDQDAGEEADELAAAHGVAAKTVAHLLTAAAGHAAVALHRAGVGAGDREHAETPAVGDPIRWQNGLNDRTARSPPPT